MEIYEFQQCIGNGMFGQVFLATHKFENKQYAIKRINFKDISPKDRENIENEVKLLHDLKHPNIVSYKDSFCDKENFFNIVMVYCEGGDMYQKIKNMKNKHLSEGEILDYIVQLGLALSYVHDKKILHRDLKTQNIFLKDGKIRIGDFGIAKAFNHTKDLANSMIGTPLYMSPEQFNSKKYGFKSDIWAFGCCLFEFCNYKHAFEGSNWNAVAMKVIKGTKAPVNSMYSKDLRTLVDQMLNVNPNNRPTINSILEKPFIKKRVVNYILDNIKNYKTDPNMDVSEEQIDILKEQAEKLGIFNTLMKELNINEDDRPNIKQFKEKEEKISKYLKKKQDQKLKLEEKLKELENQRKQLLANLKGRPMVGGKKETSLERKQNVVRGGAVAAKMERDSSNSKKVVKQINFDDEYARLGGGAKLGRPDSNKKADRKISHEALNESKDQKAAVMINKENFNSDDLNSQKTDLDSKPKFLENKKQLSKNKKASVTDFSNTKNQEKPTNVRPTSGLAVASPDIQSKEEEVLKNKKRTTTNNLSKVTINNSSIPKFVKNNNVDDKIPAKTGEDSFEENSDPVKKDINEEKRLLFVTQEISKTKSFLEKTNNKIEKIEKKIGETLVNLNNDNFDYEDLDSDLSGEEEAQEEVNQKADLDISEHDKQILDMNKMLRSKCEATLGYKLFTKAYDYVKVNKDGKTDSVREHLINLFGKNNIGYMHLILQILFNEDLLLNRNI